MTTKYIAIQNAIFAILALSSLIFFLEKTVDSLGHTTFDDAYMFTRYVQHWLSGDGFSWNTEDGLAYGITSPAYLFTITAIVGATNYSDAMALTVASFMAGLLAVASLVVLGFIVQRGPSRSWAPLLIVPAVLLLSPFQYHSLTGMATTSSLLANSLLACAIVFTTHRRSAGALALCLAAGALSYSTRPDNGLYALCLPPLFMVAADRSLWRYAATYAILFAGLVGLSLIVNRAMFGDYLPLPFFAKRSGFYEGYVGAAKWNAMREMLVFYVAALPFVLVIVFTISKATALRVTAIAAVIVATFAYYATVTQSMGAHARYYYPSLAFVVMAAAVAWGQRENWLSFIAPRVVVALVALLPPPAKNLAINLWARHVIDQPDVAQSATRYRMASANQLPKLGWAKSIVAMRDLLSSMPEGTVIAASEYGYIGSQLPKMTIVDLVGLHDRNIAHRGFSAEYILSRQPDLIWLPHSDYTGAIVAITDDPTFRQKYELYHGAYDYGIALRKTSEFYDDMQVAAESEFSRVYPGRRMAEYKAEPVTR